MTAALVPLQTERRLVTKVSFYHRCDRHRHHLYVHSDRIFVVITKLIIEHVPSYQTLETDVRHTVETLTRRNRPFVGVSGRCRAL